MRRRRSTGAGVSLDLTCLAWVFLLARELGAPWAFVPAFLLFGVTGAVVGLAAAIIDRTRLALLAIVAGCIAPIATYLYVMSRPEGWLS